MGHIIEGNGLERWRKLFTEYHGSNNVVKPAGRAKLLDVAQCTSMKHANNQSDEWVDLLYRYEDEMGAPTIQMLGLRILPNTLYEFRILPSGSRVGHYSRLPSGRLQEAPKWQTAVGSQARAMGDDGVGDRGRAAAG